MDDSSLHDLPPTGRRPSSRYASTALFLGMVSLVASFVVIGGVMGIGAIVLGVGTVLVAVLLPGRKSAEPAPQAEEDKELVGTR